MCLAGLSCLIDNTITRESLKNIFIRFNAKLWNFHTLNSADDSDEREFKTSALVFIEMLHMLPYRHSAEMASYEL